MESSGKHKTFHLASVPDLPGGECYLESPSYPRFIIRIMMWTPVSMNWKGWDSRTLNAYATSKENLNITLK